MGMAPTATVDKGLDKKDVDTKVHPDDTPEAWLARVLTISRRQLSSILAQRWVTHFWTVLTLQL
jgi:hypothetical protein